MLEDLRTCLRLPNCDLLVIIDDCNITGCFNASRWEPIGKQKIEILMAGAAEAENNAAIPGWFTRLLTQTLSNLLKINPRGFPVFRLYLEIYNENTDAKPRMFNLSGGHRSEIWLCPPIPSSKPPAAKTKGELVLNLSLRLAGQHIETSMMNDIASHLQLLPHVEAIRFQDLSAPSKEIADFMQLVIRAQKIQPLLRRLHARRQFQKTAELSQDSGIAAPSMLRPRGIMNGRNQVPKYDWSNVSRAHSLKDSEESVSPPAKKARRLGH